MAAAATCVFLLHKSINTLQSTPVCVLTGRSSPATAYAAFQVGECAVKKKKSPNNFEYSSSWRPSFSTASPHNFNSDLMSSALVRTAVGARAIKVLWCSSQHQLEYRPPQIAEARDSQFGEWSLGGTDKNNPAASEVTKSSHPPRQTCSFVPVVG